MHAAMMEMKGQGTKDSEGPDSLDSGRVSDRSFATHTGPGVRRTTVLPLQRPMSEPCRDCTSSLSAVPKALSHPASSVLVQVEDSQWTFGSISATSISTVVQSEHLHVAELFKEFAPRDIAESALLSRASNRVLIGNILLGRG